MVSMANRGAEAAASVAASDLCMGTTNKADAFHLHSQCVCPLIRTDRPLFAKTACRVPCVSTTVIEGQPLDKRLMAISDW